MQNYSAEDKGIGLTMLEDAVQMCTKGELYEYLIKIAAAAVPQTRPAV